MSPHAHDRRPGPLLVWGALAIVYVVWGSTYLGIRVAIETMPPLLHGSLRFLAAGVVLALVLLAVKGRQALRVTRREFLSAALIGLLLLTAGNGMVAIAEQHISSGLAALLVASVPLWLVIFRTAARDRPPLLTLAGVLIGFTGVALLSLSGNSGGATSHIGVIVILLASLSWSVGSFLSGRITMPRDPFAASVYEMLAGGLALGVVGLARGERLDVTAVSGHSWLALAYLIVFGSLIAFTSYAWLLGNAPISLVATYAYVNPVVAVALGVAVLNERVTTPILAAGAVIVLGVALVVSTESLRNRRARTPDPALTD
ncbi:EamA family transporter [Bailinhaonella thermotolerans]|uniref:EamA family transporter n=1 Tax=Bailinhaonella thermotolerans TaxID=1070861 RepID=A0A3A4ATQ8_9ACTN|nr:EamA family transporter [Bailinhaonella thermotolerans]RJL31999.1 EamA family transporter [Bailinhaonella thermotolerans]